MSKFGIKDEINFQFYKSIFSDRLFFFFIFRFEFCVNFLFFIKYWFVCFM